MDNPPTLKLRKAPSQQRSEQRVDDIIAAYIRLLEKGEERMSTNAIAKEARVPVSSVYQYFPNKEAIAFCIYRQWATDAIQVLKKRCADAESACSLLDFLADNRSDLFSDITNARIVLRLGPIMDSSSELKEAKRRYLGEMTEIIVDILRKLGSTWSAAALANLVSLLIELSTATFRHMARQSSSEAAHTYEHWRLGARAMLKHCVDTPTDDATDKAN
ncbi:TetR/AcrR family transcriptional regulator [Pseudomonas sp. NFX15]|uniref:TetR/AcrR family transcriptional regulator n=1 Tax=Pseudomonas sp. NFX15 TaxID=2816958 RepID=UPI003B8C3C0E